MRKSNSIKVMCGVMVASIGIGAVSSYALLADEEDYLQNVKYQNEVSNQLNADMCIMNLYHNNGVTNNKFVRLKPNESKKIYVNIGEEISSRALEHIKITLNELNTAFSHINDLYNFEICSYQDFVNYKKDKNTTISFEYTKLADKVYGLAESSLSTNKLFNYTFENKQTYIKKASIYFDSQTFDTLSDESQLFVIKHEIMHALGFADIYNYYDDETSIMNVGIVGLSTHLSPNDLKMLYVAYGNKHINSDGSFNQQNLDKVVNLIKTYEKKYYQYLISNIRKITGGKFNAITPNEINNKTFSYNEATVTINGDNFIYQKDDRVQKGKLIFGEDYVILPDIKLENEYVQNYNDFLVLLKQKEVINCRNFNIFHYGLSDNLDPLKKEIGILLN